MGWDGGGGRKRGTEERKGEHEGGGGRGREGNSITKLVIGHITEQMVG